MSKLHQFFDMDFGHAVTIDFKVVWDGAQIDGKIIYDFLGNSQYVSLYDPDPSRSVSFYRGLVGKVLKGGTIDNLSSVRLPAANVFNGDLEFDRTGPAFLIKGKFFGEEQWHTLNEMRATGRLFLHSETDLSQADLEDLYTFVKSINCSLVYRGNAHVARRTRQEIPVAFISHDSRDKESIARPIAQELQRRLLAVWYDEYSLKIGDNLRESIERGLKDCKKCILVLSPNFLGNGGWTKREFDSIFTREILEQQHLVLPIWCGVTKKEIYEFSPSLLNIKALDWNLGSAEVCRQLYDVLQPLTEEHAAPFTVRDGT